ncbi:MAG: two-component regulator propeller domain-containing protein [Pseudomonadota bacterium]
MPGRRPDSQPKSGVFEAGIPQTLRNPNAEPAPVPPVAGIDPAPLLKASLVNVQSLGAGSGKAIIAGLAGAAVPGVTGICAQRPDGSQDCSIAAEPDGSFTGLLENLKPGQIVSLWGIGPGFGPGGKGINSIDERVQYWRTRFPENVRAFARAPDRLWIGSDEGLWFLSHAELNQSPAELYPRKLDIRDGLPDTQITSLIFDPAGDLWIGTPRGLVRLRLDSSGAPNFRVFSKEDGLADSSVTSLALEPSGRLWVGTSSGLYCLKTDAGGGTVRITRLSATTDPVLSLAILDADRLWIGTAYRLILASGLKQESYRFEFHDCAKSNGQRMTGFSALAVDDSGVAWSLTGLGLCRLAFDAPGAPRFQVFTAADGLSDATHLRTLLADGAGGLWVGTMARGLDHLTIDPGGALSVRNYSTTDGLPSNNVRTLASIDGALWIGTATGGMSRFLPASGSSFTNYFIADGLPSNKITALVTDAARNLWIGLENAGIRRMAFDAEGIARFTNPARDGDLPSPAVTALALDGEGTLWIATRAGLARFREDPAGVAHFATEFPTESLGTAVLLNLAVDRDGSLWIGSGAGVTHRTVDAGGNVEFTSYTVFNDFELPDGLTLSLSPDPSGGVWIGSDNGLTRLKLDPEGRASFSYYLFAAGFPSYARSIYAASATELWVGYYDGLSRILFAEDGTPEVQGVPLGPNPLSRHAVRNIQPGAQGQLWVATTDGLYEVRADAQGNVVSAQYSAAAGLPGDRYSCVAPYGTSGLFLGTDSGLVLFPVPPESR